MLRILHTDDHPIIRVSVKTILQNSMPDAIYEEANNSDSTFHKIIQNKYDLVILDVSIHGDDSVGLVKRILALRPETKILMLSMQAKDSYAKKYFKLGVKGFISKEATVEQMSDAISAILNNNVYLFLSYIAINMFYS
jgi:two-component system, NarL family, invasion response regulator UvrY